MHTLGVTHSVDLSGISKLGLGKSIHVKDRVQQADASATSRVIHQQFSVRKLQQARRLLLPGRRGHSMFCDSYVTMCVSRAHFVFKVQKPVNK